MGIPHHVSMDARGHSGRRGAALGLASRKFDRITRLASAL
jgi:hypothetical protein